MDERNVSLEQHDAAARRGWRGRSPTFLVVEHDAQRDQQRHRRPPRAPWASPPTPRARRAPPTTCATPGSPASRPTCCAWSGWASTTTRPSNLSGAQGRAADLGGLHEGRAGGHQAPSASRCPPANIVFVEIDTHTGLLATPVLPDARSRRRSSPAPSRRSTAPGIRGRPPTRCGSGLPAPSPSPWR